MKVFYPLLLLWSLCFLGACTKDALPEPMAEDCINEGIPTYEGEVVAIIERNCAYSGCHLGGAPGVYNDYDGLLSDLQSGRFRQRTVTLREDPAVGMPPDYAPDGRPQNLTPDELRTLTCWLEAGYPRE